MFKSHSISFRALMSWNSLPVTLRGPIRSISLINFKRKQSISLLKYNYFAFQTMDYMTFYVYFKDHSYFSFAFRLFLFKCIFFFLRLVSLYQQPCFLFFSVCFNFVFALCFIWSGAFNMLVLILF